MKKEPSKKVKNVTQINLRNVKLTKESRKTLKNINDGIWENVANVIECGNWWIPVKNYKYSHIKKSFENGMYKFFNIDRKTAKIDIDGFMTDIIEYDNNERNQHEDKQRRKRTNQIAQ